MLCHCNLHPLKDSTITLSTYDYNVQLEEQRLGFSPAPSCNWKKDSGAISGTPARNLFQLNLFSQKISYTEAFQFLQIFCQRMRQMDMAGENCNWSVFNHWTCAMNRVLAERVFEAVWPWGHNRKEAVGTEFLQAQGRDYDCVPFTNVCINGHVCINTDSKRRSPKWQIWWWYQWWNTSLSQMSRGSAAACCLTASSGFKFNSLSIWKFDEFAKRGRVLIIMSNLVNSVWEKTAVFSQL